ncbi:MerR family transcriptional regulator [Saccharothrix texasensis]|uniref:MerR family transcriptional regulator n=1 Tax=Saccharothrix texasensis TaxID=103734 RepID=UPI001FEACA36|nr:MerR family transcriptional regulator [Saccharothrix texasensis]
MTAFSSGRLAEAAGVNHQTLRYYERRGLLSEPDRTPGGHRLYPPEALTVLRMIKAAQRLGSPWTRSPTCSTRAAGGSARAVSRGCGTGS